MNVLIESAHNKTYNKTCVTSKDSDQPVHPPSMARVLIYSSLASPEVVEGNTISAETLMRLWLHRLIRVFHGCASLIVGFF